EQPDLNWRNPKVEEAMHAALRFWLDRGVDGFRVDAISRLIKDGQFRDNPPNPDYTPDQPAYRRLLAAYSADQPEVHAVIGRIRRLIDRYPGRVLIGEAYLSVRQLIGYYGRGGGVHFPFNFLLVTQPWTAEGLRQAIAGYTSAL